MSWTGISDRQFLKAMRVQPCDIAEPEPRDEWREAWVHLRAASRFMRQRDWYEQEARQLRVVSFVAWALVAFLSVWLVATR